MIPEMEKMHMDRFTRYETTFRTAGLRMTDQRRVICEWLAHTDQHPTPYQVYEGIAATNPEISRATIYNTLNTLQQLGAIIEISMGADETHYETNPSPHMNLICLRCHRVIDLHLHQDEYNPLELSAGLSDQIHRQTGFHAYSSRTDVLGICDKCAANTPAQNGDLL
jgi:Fur family peroxide stress response transcriptional regulator